jgi:hypothetical protein
LRAEVTQRKQTNANVVKVLIDNVILAIKMSASILSVQEIHDHLAKHTTISECWCSKNYAFEFVESINSVSEKQLLDKLCKSQFHTLILDESAAFFAHNIYRNKAIK